MTEKARYDLARKVCEPLYKNGVETYLIEQMLDRIVSLINQLGKVMNYNKL